METVIILSLVGILLVGCWHVGNVFQKHRKQLETDPESGGGGDVSSACAAADAVGIF